jgi:hypothetical protein
VFNTFYNIANSISHSNGLLTTWAEAEFFINEAHEAQYGSTNIIYLRNWTRNLNNTVFINPYIIHIEYTDNNRDFNTLIYYGDVNLNFLIRLY